MKFTPLLADDAVLAELGRRLADTRLSLQLTQAELAANAGVSKRTIERLEDGASTQLSNLIRCLRALNRLEALDVLAPEAQPNPVDLLKRRNRTRTRKRSRTRGQIPPSGQWVWGDEK